MKDRLKNMSPIKWFVALVGLAIIAPIAIAHITRDWTIIQMPFHDFIIIYGTIFYMQYDKSKTLLINAGLSGIFTTPVIFGFEIIAHSYSYLFSIDLNTSNIYDYLDIFFFLFVYNKQSIIKNKKNR